jgi:hypothetical protein
MSDIGDAILNAILGYILFWIVATSLVVGSIAFFVGRYSVDSTESAKAKAERKQVIDSLTDEQRKVLGL